MLNQPQRNRIIVFSVLWALLAPGGRTQEQFKLPLKIGSVRFAIIGDMGTGDKAQYDVSKRLSDARQYFPYTFILTMGDNLYGGSSPSDFEKKFELPYKALLDTGMKFYATLGNHDNPNERSYKYFSMDGANYYTFLRGNVRFFVLDSNYMDPKQLAWLEGQLRDAGNSVWKICYFHHPLYSSARTHGSATDLRVLLEPLFIKYGVNVVFAGHEHVYERFKPQHGIYYFTEGSSGQLRVGDLKKDPEEEKGFDADNTFMLVEVAGDEMYFQAISRAGQPVDSGIIERQQQSGLNSITGTERADAALH